MTPWWPWGKRASASEHLTAATLDQAALARLRELDREGEPAWSAQFLRDYASHLETGLEEIRAAAEAADAGEVAGHAHRLKSVSKQVGASDLALLLLEIEKAGSKGGAVPDTGQLAALELEARRVRLAIDLELAG